MFGLGLWRLRRGTSSTAKEKESVLNTFLGRAIAFTSSHAHIIRQKTPEIDTHQLDSQDGLRKPERGTTVVKSSKLLLPLSLVPVFLLERNGINLRQFCGYPRKCRRLRQIKENKAESATDRLQNRSWRDLRIVMTSATVSRMLVKHLVRN